MRGGAGAELASALARDLARLDRRGFLRAVGLAAGAGLLPAGCADAPAALAPPPDAQLRHLSPRSYAVVTAVAERVAGPRGGELVRSGAARPGIHVDAFLAAAPELAAPLDQALFALEFAPFPLIAKLRPFTALGGPARDAVLRELRDSRLGLKRALYRGVRSVALWGFWASEASYPLCGYPGPDGRTDVSIADAMRPLES